MTGVRDYKAEYKKFQSSTKSKKYRAELNQYNRKKGTYGNGDGKDASHKGGKIVGFESQSKNRGRAEKSRLKKESSSDYGKSIEKIANDRKLKSISKKDRVMLIKIAKLMKKANESVNEKMGPKQYHQYMQYVFDTQFKTSDEKKMKKSMIKKINVSQKKKGLPIFKEGGPGSGKPKDDSSKDKEKEIERKAKEQAKKDMEDEFEFDFDESVSEDNIKFSKEEMAQLHKDGKVEKGGHTIEFGESVNEVDRRAKSQIFREWNKFEKAFSDYFKAVVKLGKVNTKVTGDKTDEKIMIKNFNKEVGKFYTLMQGWVRGQNESVNESDLGLTYKKGKTVKVKHKSSGKRLVIVDKPNVKREYEKIGYFAEAKTKSIDGKALYDFLQKRFKMSKSKAIATMKKHKMDMSFLKKESVNESIELPLGKVFTGHGRAFVKEEVEPQGNMGKIQFIVKSKTAMKVGGVMIDMQSANLLMKLWDAVSDKDKEKMNKLPAKKLTLVIKRLWSRVKLKLPI